MDAAQGIEAQTLANLYLAMENDLTIIPVLNKIDLPAAQPEKFAEELANLVGCEPDDVLKVSAKTGLGVETLLDRVVAEVPAPVGVKDAPARAMIFRLGVRLVPRGRDVRQGHRRPAQQARAHPDDVHGRDARAAGDRYELAGDAVLRRSRRRRGGYLITGVKDVRQSKVGDTITSQHKGAEEALGGYKKPKPMVFSGLYPMDGSDYPLLRDALDKLHSTTRPWSTSRRRPRPSGSASAWASWACCTST
ncbi:translation elongation factor 4 [Streptomyces hirsutus]